MIKIKLHRLGDFQSSNYLIYQRVTFLCMLVNTDARWRKLHKRLRSLKQTMQNGAPSVKKEKNFNLTYHVFFFFLFVFIVLPAKDTMCFSGLNNKKLQSSLGTGTVQCSLASFYLKHFEITYFKCRFCIPQLLSVTGKIAFPTCHLF